MDILCVGDSLTFGNVGYSYIHFLRQNTRYRLINKGRNGDTVRGAYARLKGMIDARKYDAEAYILGIGTNDLLLPYLKTVSPLWSLHMSLRCKVMKCIENDEEFHQAFKKTVSLLHERCKPVIVLGMPFINLEGFPHELLKKRNRVMHEVADAYSCPFIDTYRLQTEMIPSDSREYTWRHKNVIRIADALMMTLFPLSKDCFSKARGLTTSVDGVHLSSCSARLLAAEIEKTLAARAAGHGGPAAERGARRRPLFVS